jgi:hypothetical protein
LLAQKLPPRFPYEVPKGARPEGKESATERRPGDKEPPLAAPLDAENFAIALTTPLPLLYLEQESVRAELKLTKEQATKAAALLARWSGRAMQEDANQRTGLEMIAAARKQLDEMLTVAQMRRLKQVILRHREREFGLAALLGSLAGELNLSGEQQQKFDAMRQQRAEAVLEQLTSGERAPAIRRKVHDTNTEYVAKIDQLLTKDQRDRLKELLGEPFAGDIKLREPVSPAFASRSVYLDKLFLHYSVEPEFLINASVQKELRMTDDQVRKARELHVEWSKRIEDEKKTIADPADVLVAQDELVSRELKNILKPAQFDRFVSIMMQYRERLAGVAGACGHPIACEVLKLDAEDARKLRAGTPLDKVLPGVWFSKYSRLVGLPFTGEVTINNPLIVERKTPAKRPVPAVPLVDEMQITLPTYMLQNSKQFKLTDAQVARLKDMAEDAPKVRELLHRELSNLPPPTMLNPSKVLPEARALEIYRKSVFEQCLDVFDKEQRASFGGQLKRAFRDY